MRTSQKLTLATAAIGFFITGCSAKVETPDAIQIPVFDTGNQPVDPVNPGPSTGRISGAFLGKKFRHLGNLDIQFTSPGGNGVKIERNCSLGGGFCETLGQLNHETFGLSLNDSSSTYFARLPSDRRATTSGTATESSITLTTHIVTNSGKAVGDAIHQMSYRQNPCDNAGPGLEDMITLRTYYPDGYSDQEICMPFFE